eukprot:TRINITY_DN3131_c0_g1_i1.p2 TRINITY_DN3131_c0_g1~~TRINITY_DN3131_c0_g1_i1.p2  ORF type:complete len:134 (-),score=58.15 TRINITY_DN3131_c0_g1_i1:124-525(-)
MTSVEKVMAELQRKLNEELGALKEIQKQIPKLTQQRTQLISQQNENQMVQQELKLMEEDGKIYKLIGPALVQQDKSDAMAIVEKRLDYLSNEIGRLEAQSKSLEDKADDRRKAIMQIQQQAQQIARKARQQSE